MGEKETRHTHPACRGSSKAPSHSRSLLSTRQPFRWLIPLLLGNFGIYFLLSSPHDGVHCNMMLPPEAKEAAAPVTAARIRGLLEWAQMRGLLLSPSVGLGLLPDTSYSGMEHAWSDWERRRAAQRSKGASVRGDLLNEHGWGLEVRRPLVRGLVARSTMPVGDTVCILPLSLALRANATLEGGTATVASDGLPRLADDIERLAVKLFVEKALGPQSQWSAYIASLPQSVPLPLMLPPEDLRQIQWGYTQGQVRSMQREIQGSYNFLVASGGFRRTPDFALFRWAVSIVQSRAFRIPFKGQAASIGSREGELVLVPFMDAINHNYRNNIDWMARPITENNTLEMVLKRPAAAGDQIFTSFGPRSNDDLFLYYGFLLDSNPFDSLAIFKSFQDAGKWLVDALDMDCDTRFLEAADSSPGSAADSAAGPVKISTSCPRVAWEEVLAAAQAAGEKATPPEGLEREGEDWEALLGEWGELGYEFLPYRPGPNVKPGGVVDPALLNVFAASLALWNGSLPVARFPGCADRPPKGSSHKGSRPYSCCRDLDSRLVCAGAPDAKKAAAADYIRMAVVRRCRQILVSLPTSVAEDRRLLRDIATQSPDGSGLGCMLGQTKITEPWVLAVRYRLQKKEMLLEVIHRYGSG